MRNVGVTHESAKSGVVELGVCPSIRPFARPDALTDVREHYRQNMVSSPGSSVSAQDLYDCCDWCVVHGKQALTMPVYCRELKVLRLRKGKVCRRVHYPRWDRRRLWFMAGVSDARCCRCERV